MWLSSLEATAASGSAWRRGSPTPAPTSPSGGPNPRRTRRPVSSSPKRAGAAPPAELCDVSDEDQVIASFARTVDALGKVDSVFANAGTGGRIPSVTELSLADWRRVLAVNLDGAFLTLREGARHMVERGEGGALVA